MLKLTPAVGVIGLLLLPLTSSSSAETYVLKAGILIDGWSDSAKRGLELLVQDGKIVAVDAKVEAPEGATILEFPDKTILPGFIDAHSHIMSRGEEEYGDQLYKASIPSRTIRAVVAARTALLNGFTAMRDMGSEGTMYADADLKEAIADGVVPGPSLWVSTRGLSVAGAYVPFGYSWELELPKGAQVVSGPEECRKAVREQIANGADWIKVFVDWDTQPNEEGKISGPVTFSAEELEMIVKEAHRLGRKVAAHATGAAGIKSALDAGVDSIEHGDGLDDAAISRAKADGVYLCPTIMPPEHVAAKGKVPPELQELLAIKYASLRKAYKAGVKLVLGSDAGSFPWTNNQAKEFELLVTKVGLSPMDSIKAGTSVAAELIGQSKNLGALAPGMNADIVVVPGNPLEDIAVLQNVIFVMKNGAIVRNDQ